MTDALVRRSFAFTQLKQILDAMGTTRKATEMTIGYIGVGNMGGALAARLQETHSLVVHDRSAAATEPLVRAGATQAADVEDLGSRCQTILLCLPTSNHVHDLLFGADGLADAVAPGTIIIDQTSGDPTTTRKIAETLGHRGIDFIDAPVSGGISGARAGTIAIMVGADHEQLERAQPTLESISPNIFHTGEVGTGHAMKLVNNLISGTQRLLTFEGMALAAKNGIDPHKAVEILLAGGARNSFMEKVLQPRILNGDLNVNFTLGLAHKDVRLACQLGIDSEVPMFYGNLTKELLQLYIAEMGSNAQVDTAAVVVDRLSKTRVVPADYQAD